MRPYSSPARYILLALPLVVIPVAVWLWALLAERAQQADYGPHMFLLGLGFFLSLVLVAMLVYLAWCAFTIRYSFERDSLVLRCGGVRHVIPLGSIAAIYAPGEKVDGKTIAVRWSGLAGSVPGYMVGHGTSPQLGRVMAVATAQPSGLVYIATEGGRAYGVSPENRATFAAELDRRRKAAQEDAESSNGNGRAAAGKPGKGAVRVARSRVELRGISGLAAGLWADRTARWLMLAGLALCALVFGYTALVYSGLPVRLGLHWNAQAQIDRIGSPQELLRLPVFGLAIWLVNVAAGWWALPRERAATLTLLAGAAAAQVVFAAGALSIVLRAT